MEVVVNLGVMFGFALACALIAHSRGRSPVGWFFVGVFTNCIGLIILLVLPDVKVEQAKFARLQKENMRLKERLKKDRQVADSRHSELSRRISTHDRALGLDTGERQPILGPGEGPGVAGGLPDASAAHPALSTAEWYYVVEGEAKGPVTLADLRALANESLITQKSLVWHDGMPDWQSLADVPGLSEDLYG